MARARCVSASAAMLGLIGCAEPGVTESTRVPVCGSGGSVSVAPGTGAAGSTMTPPSTGGAETGMGGMVGTTGTGGTPATGGSPAGSTGSGGTPGMGGTPEMGGTTNMGGTSGVAGATGAGGAEQPPGPCPSGYMCVNLSSLGATAVDGAGKPITASCGMGAPSASCDDANPSSTCAGLTNPLCAHVSVAGMQIVSCGQRCTP